MIDERFAASAFSARGVNTEGSRSLADQLANAITEELQHAVGVELARIINQLNQLGHNLKPKETALGEFSYRDDYEDETGYHCKLRVALDLVVSTGYAHVITAGES
jgi:hypothetical protein